MEAVQDTSQTSSLGAGACDDPKSSSQNTPQPVDRCLPEPLSLIAWFVSADDPDARSVIKMTHVCKNWRTALISAPEVWGMISSGSRWDLTVLTLERLKAAPLEMWLNMNEIGQKPGFAGLIKNHTENTVLLRFSGLRTLDDLNQTLPTFPKSMTKLRSLSLNCYMTEPPWDQSEDPFGSFPATLECLRLSNFPLYQSFLNLRTLTLLELYCCQLDCSLARLFEFLESNPSLEWVNLSMEPMDPGNLKYQAPVSIKKPLEFLQVRTKDAEVIEGLVSSTPLQLGATLDIDYLSPSTEFRKILEWVSATNPEILNSPDYMEFRGRCAVKLSGPNGDFSFTGRYNSVASLVGFPSYKKIRMLYLEDTSIEFNPSLFPALEILVIKEEEKPSKVLSTLFKSPQSCTSLKTLGFSHSKLTDDFMVELVQFSSQYKDLCCVVIAHTDPETCSESILQWIPSPASIAALREHVRVDIWGPDEELSRDVM